MKPIRSAFALAVGIAACVTAVRVNATSSASVYRDLELLGQSISIVRDAYVDPVDVSVLVDFALRSMVESLDQHSTYLDSQDLEAIKQETEGTFSGVGLILGVRNGFITVVAPLEGSPAAEAGIRPADTILEIDGQTTQGMPLRRAVTLLRGPSNTSVRVLIRRRGIDADVPVVIMRRIITIPSVPHAFELTGPDDSRIAYVRLATFASRAAEGFRSSLARVAQGGCIGLVVDLRANAGGLLEQAVAVCEALLPQGSPICTTVGNKGSRRVSYASTGPALVSSLRIAVLVEEGSASGAEIVAAAVQDNRRGIIVGRPTYGKGTVQEIRELGDGTAVKLTTARWFTPGGYCIDRELGMVDTTALAPTTSRRVGIAPNLLIDEPDTDFVRVELASAFFPGWLDSMARVSGPPRADPARYELGPDVLEAAGAWLATSSPLARVNADSAAVLAAKVAAGHASARAFLGEELARRWWGPEGAARYAAAHDTVVRAAIQALADAALYERLLDLRAPAPADTLADDDDDEFE